jgi:large subunit ribosomal protein L22
MTEKDYNPNQKENKAMEKQEKIVKQKPTVETPKKESPNDKKITKPSEAKEGEKTKAPVKKKPKKTEAIVRANNLPISTKDSAAICKFIKRKKIVDAIADLEQVITHKKAVPMKGEIPHRKGKRMMSGRYPKKATEYFIRLLRSLSANANSNELNNPIIIEAIANIGSRPFGKFGRVRKKRTNIKIKVKEKLNKKKKKNE